MDFRFLTEDLLIRPIELKDEGDVRALWSAPGARFWPFHHSWKEFTENPDHQSRYWLVAERQVDGIVVGSVRGTRRGNHNTVVEIVVAENARREGVGAALLEAAGVVPGSATRALVLKTNLENEASNAFYLRQGFELSGFSHTRREEIMFQWSRWDPRVRFPAVHLEGMGLLGSLTALELARHGMPFTWHDPDFPAAWRASTGIVLPSASPGHMKWLGAVREHDFPWAERGTFWTTQKNPGSAVPAADLGALRSAKLPSVHVNVQKLVQDVRTAFRGLERDAHPDLREPEAIRVRAHGFNERLTGYLWGWSRLVEVKISDRIAEMSPHRPSFFVMKNRVEKAYCAPVPGTGLYCIGSSMITMKSLKEREMGPELGKCLKLLGDMGGDLFSVQNLIGETRQGWRPVGAKGLKQHELEWAHPSMEAEQLLYPPMSHSGVSEGLDIAHRAASELRARLLIPEEA